MYASHLPEGTDWITWDEGSGTIDITGTKPNHQYVCYIKGNLCPGAKRPTSRRGLPQLAHCLPWLLPHVFQQSNELDTHTWSPEGLATTSCV